MEYRKLKRFEFDSELHASKNQRFVNYLIDYIMQIIIVVGIGVVLTMIALFLGNEELLARIESMNRFEEYALGAVIVLIYYNIFEIFFARTIGKFITKTVVVNELGEKPTVNEILVRSVCRIIPFEAFSFLGEPGKGWHDSISKTYVVRKEVLDRRKSGYNSLDEIGRIEEEI